MGTPGFLPWIACKSVLQPRHPFDPLATPSCTAGRPNDNEANGQWSCAWRDMAQGVKMPQRLLAAAGLQCPLPGPGASLAAACLCTCSSVEPLPWCHGAVFGSVGDRDAMNL